jgi:hypothetical protein
MPRKPRPLDRDTDVLRDASLIVIASEDTYAVQEYFSSFRPRRVQFKVLSTKDGLSSPEHIVVRLDNFKSEFLLDESDQLWYCGDTDHWIMGQHLPNLLRVIQHCNQAGYHVALSNPCFELWLLLHFSDLPDGLETCQSICDELAAAAGGYSKDSGCSLSVTSEMVYAAKDRAWKLDAGTDRVPMTPTTRIYRILELLIQRESIVVGTEKPKTE